MFGRWGMMVRRFCCDWLDWHGAVVRAIGGRVVSGRCLYCARPLVVYTAVPAPSGASVPRRLTRRVPWTQSSDRS